MLLASHKGNLRWQRERLSIPRRPREAARLGRRGQQSSGEPAGPQPGDLTSLALPLLALTPEPVSPSPCGNSRGDCVSSLGPQLLLSPCMQASCPGSSVREPVYLSGSPTPHPGPPHSLPSQHTQRVCDYSSQEVKPEVLKESRLLVFAADKRVKIQLLEVRRIMPDSGPEQ